MRGVVEHLVLGSEHAPELALVAEAVLHAAVRAARHLPLEDELEVAEVRVADEIAGAGALRKMQHTIDELPARDRRAGLAERMPAGEPGPGEERPEAERGRRERRPLRGGRLHEHDE